MARSRVSKSCLKVELCFHRYVHFVFCSDIHINIDIDRYRYRYIGIYIIYIDISIVQFDNQLICTLYIYILFNLITSLYTRYKKSNDNLLYINTSSGHPPQVIKQLTNFISKRLCENSTNEQVCNTIKPAYENA